jgi:hypothetical protein
MVFANEALRMIFDEGVMSFLKNQFSLLIIAPEKGYLKVKPPFIKLQRIEIYFHAMACMAFQQPD